MGNQNCSRRFSMYTGDGKSGLKSYREQKARNRAIPVAAGVCGLCLSCSAVASPPFSWGGSSSAVASARSVSLVSRPIARQQYTPTTNLDLRPPGASLAAISHEGAAAPASEPFPATTHRLKLGQSDLPADNRIQARTLGI